MTKIASALAIEKNEKKTRNLLRNEANDAWIPEQTIWERDWTAYLLSSTNQDIRIPCTTFEHSPAHRSPSLALLRTQFSMWFFDVSLFYYDCLCCFWGENASDFDLRQRFSRALRFFSLLLVVMSQCLVLSVNRSRMENWIFIKCQCIHNGNAHQIHFKWGKDRFDSNDTIQYCTSAHKHSHAHTLFGP